MTGASADLAAVERGVAVGPTREICRSTISRRALKESAGEFGSHGYFSSAGLIEMNQVTVSWKSGTWWEYDCCLLMKVFTVVVCSEMCSFVSGSQTRRLRLTEEEENTPSQFNHLRLFGDGLVLWFWVRIVWIYSDSPALCVIVVW